MIVLPRTLTRSAVPMQISSPLRRRIVSAVGGRKGSSYGPREQGSYAREFFTVVKTAYTLP